MNLKVDLPILICGFAVAMLVRHFNPQAEFKIVGIGHHRGHDGRPFWRHGFVAPLTSGEVSAGLLQSK
jgi:hypothetical protein